MRRGAAPVQWALTLACLLGSLVLVAWRQARALEAHAELDRLTRQISLARTELGDLARSVQYLEGRGRVLREAGERLGMRMPATDEMLFLTRDAG
ncbi:MAG: hypothetical protein D6701_01400 [Gemmatimonadetes bacterium]|nr:MAG: hypothetical protein D6701_01400 [Gemmatimonadota bacterium]